MGTCEQRDTGQGHPDKGTGQRTVDYLQIHDSLRWNGRYIYMYFGSNKKKYQKKKISTIFGGHIGKKVLKLLRTRARSDLIRSIYVQMLRFLKRRFTT